MFKNICWIVNFKEVQLFTLSFVLNKWEQQYFLPAGSLWALKEEKWKSSLFAMRHTNVKAFSGLKNQNQIQQSLVLHLYSDLDLFLTTSHSNSWIDPSTFIFPLGDKVPNGSVIAKENYYSVLNYFHHKSKTSQTGSITKTTGVLYSDENPTYKHT